MSEWGITMRLPLPPHGRLATQDSEEGEGRNNGDGKRHRGMKMTERHLCYLVSVIHDKCIQTPTADADTQTVDSSYRSQLTPASSLMPCYIFPTAPALCSVRILMSWEWSTLPLSMKCCRVERLRGSYSLRKLQLEEQKRQW